MFALVFLLWSFVVQPTPEPALVMFGGPSSNPIKCVAPSSGSAKIHCVDSKGTGVDLPITCDSQMVTCSITK